MKSYGLEQILILIAFIALPLLNVLFERVKRYYKAKHPEGESRPVIVQEAQAIPQKVREHRKSRERLLETQVQAVSTPLPVKNSATILSLGSRREMRRGIVLMAVLGPCRAFDPPSWNN